MRAPHTHTWTVPTLHSPRQSSPDPPPSVARERVHSTAHEPREGKQGAAGEWWKAAGVGERERAPGHRPVPGPAPPCARPAPRAMPSLPRRTLAHMHADHSRMHQHSLPTPAADTLVRGHARATHRMTCTRPTVPPAPRWAARAWPGFPGGVPVPSRASGVLLLVALSPSPRSLLTPLASAVQHGAELAARGVGVPRLGPQRPRLPSALGSTPTLPPSGEGQSCHGPACSWGCWELGDLGPRTHPSPGEAFLFSSQHMLSGTCCPHHQARRDDPGTTAAGPGHSPAPS